MITTMCVQNIVEVFYVEVSDGLVHSLGSWQKVNLYAASVFTGHEFWGVCKSLEFEMVLSISLEVVKQ